MQLNELGKIVREEWLRAPQIRAGIQLDAYVVMPNHIHGILVFLGEARRGVLPCAPTTFRSPSRTLGAVVRGFKGAVTKRINERRGTPDAPLWQRNYYEYVIRGGEDLLRVREYIYLNPARWEEDENHPKMLCPQGRS